ELSEHPCLSFNALPYDPRRPGPRLPYTDGERQPLPDELDRWRQPPRTSPVAAVHDHEQDGYRAVPVRPDQRSLSVRLRHQDHRLFRVVFEAERRWPVSQQPNVLHECLTDHDDRHAAWVLENRNS